MIISRLICITTRTLCDYKGLNVLAIISQKSQVKEIKLQQVHMTDYVIFLGISSLPIPFVKLF